MLIKLPVLEVAVANSWQGKSISRVRVRFSLLHLIAALLSGGECCLWVDFLPVSSDWRWWDFHRGRELIPATRNTKSERAKYQSTKLPIRAALGHSLQVKSGSWLPEGANWSPGSKWQSGTENNGNCFIFSSPKNEVFIYLFGLHGHGPESHCAWPCTDRAKRQCQEFTILSRCASVRTV